MTIQNATTLVLFLGVFNVIGGVAFGSGLRMLVRERSPRGIFLIVWGGMFGGVPGLMGASTLAAARGSPLFLVNPILFLSAVALSMTILPELAQDMGAGPLIAIGVGAVFLFAGVAVGMAALKQGSLGSALMGGGIVALVGGLAFAVGVNQLIRGKQAT